MKKNKKINTKIQKRERERERRWRNEREREREREIRGYFDNFNKGQGIGECQGERITSYKVLQSYLILISCHLKSY